MNREVGGPTSVLRMSVGERITANAGQYGRRDDGSCSMPKTPNLAAEKLSKAMLLADKKAYRALREQQNAEAA